MIGYPLYIEKGRKKAIGHPCSYLGQENVWSVNNEGALKSHRKKQELSHQVSNKLAQIERQYLPSNHTSCERDTRTWIATAEGYSQNHS